MNNSSDRVKKVKTRTLRQQWQFERIFHNVGSLARAKSILSRIAKAKSTLPEETAYINIAIAHLDRIQPKLRHNLEQSWRRYICSQTEEE